MKKQWRKRKRFSERVGCKMMRTLGKETNKKRDRAKKVREHFTGRQSESAGFALSQSAG